MELKKILILLFIIGLFGTMTNFVYLSPIPSLIAPLLFPILMFQKKKVHQVAFWLMIFFALFLTSTILYDPNALTSFRFYRYDGNFIISYLPFLVFPFFSANLNLSKIFRNFLWIATVSNSIFLLYLLVRGNLHNYSSFFFATNAAGGFFSFTTALAAVFFFYRKNLNNLFLLASNITFLFLTISRGSILGIALALLFLFFLKKKLSFLIPISISFIVILQIVILFNSFPVYQANETYNDVNTNRFLYKKYGPLNGKTANLMFRVYNTWPRALDCFFASPFVGTGVGSVNDIPFKFNGVRYLFSSNSQDKKIYAANHAHHSYLHILGEQGVIGLLIFLIFWRKVYLFIKNSKTEEPYIQDFLIVAFFSITIMSFTEHRITTPSNALPFAISFGLFFMKNKFEKKLKK